MPTMPVVDEVRLPDLEGAERLISGLAGLQSAADLDNVFE